MAKIKLSEGGFTLIPEGVTVFKVVDVKYDEDFGKMEVFLQTKSGQKHTETFTLKKKDTGEINEGALKAFSYFAKTALNDYSLDEIDETDLVGCYIQATVKHEEFEYTRGEKKGQTGKNARLNDYAVAVGFGSVDSKKEEPVEDEDLDDFLND